MKNYLIFTIISVLAICTLISSKGCYDARHSMKTVAAVISSTDTIEHRTDPMGIDHAVKEAIQLTKKEADALYSKKIDSLCKLIPIKPKQVEGFAHIDLQHTEGFTTPVIWESNHVGTFHYSNPYTDLSGKITDSSVSIADTLKLALNMANYWQRSHKLLWIRYGKIKHYTDVSSPDKAVRITNLSMVEVKTKEPGRFGAGPYVGINLSGQLQLGIAVTYSLIRW